MSLPFTLVNESNFPLKVWDQGVEDLRCHRSQKCTFLWQPKLWQKIQIQNPKQNFKKFN
jgi:hypothetical protein